MLASFACCKFSGYINCSCSSIDIDISGDIGNCIGGCIIGGCIIGGATGGCIGGGGGPSSMYCMGGLGVGVLFIP